MKAEEHIQGGYKYSHLIFSFEFHFEFHFEKQESVYLNMYKNFLSKRI